MNATGQVAIAIALAYLMQQISLRFYKREAFLAQPSPAAPQEGVGPTNCRTVFDNSYKADKPQMTREDQQGDFEQDFIQQAEGGSNPTKDAMNAARRKFPFDWSQLPPNSQLFQAQQALFAKDATNQASPQTKETFEVIEARKVLPPDSEAENAAEKEALQAQKTKVADDFKVVDQGSVESMIEKLQGDKGFIAKVARKGDNVFEIQETKEINPKIVQESDGSEPDNNMLSPMDQMEKDDKLMQPNTAVDLAVGVPPSATGVRTRAPKQTYSDYNPNLEGIFGPKMQMQQWG